MTRAEIVALVTLATAAYPAAQTKDPEPVVNAWKLMLPDIPFAVARAAVIKVCRSSPFFPSVAGVVEAARELDPCQEHLPTAAEAWEEVSRLIQDVGPYRAPQYSCDTVKRAARSIGWRQLCMGENPEADRAHFLRLYESMRSRRREQSECEAAMKMAGIAAAVNTCLVASNSADNRLVDPRPKQSGGRM